ncbi:prenyltransferase/squalene oxidase repeat-containing protein [Streptomyces sp. NPDC088789]|uniref:prenyltransferase/squalene oxidase repeat-containing protein n=1 Tax=Streptomyces sp. NPDC088789 TaxID=3365899 RepID=UPI0038147E14
MYVRRSAAVLAAAFGIGAVAAPLAQADSPSPSPSATLPAGLFGDSDPTYDGVWRQSLTLLALDSSDIQTSGRAKDWLARQQCDNGGFAAYRPDPRPDCDAKTVIDSNSTAAAVQALAAVGSYEAATEKAVGWLKSVQNKDGGWGYTPGGPSDTNSTAVVIGALGAAGEKPAEVRRDGKSPYDALLTLALPCDDGGAFAYQPGKKGELVANADATAAGVLGALGRGMVGGPGTAAEAGAGCTDADSPEQAAANGAAWLNKSLAEDGHLLSVLPGAEDQPDYGNTADAVVALAALGDTAQARKSLTWLERNASQWASESGPAAYAQLIFAAKAAGADPREFGGQDLVAQLSMTGPSAEGMQMTDTAIVKEEGEKKDDSPFDTWWYAGVFLVFGAGIGFLITRRKGKQR